MVSSLANIDFSRANIVIVGLCKETTDNLTKAFEQYKATCKTLLGYQKGLEFVLKSSLDVLIIVANGKNDSELRVFTEKVVQSKNFVPVIWTISERPIANADGYSSRQFNQKELLKAIYYSLIVQRDLVENG